MPRGTSTTRKRDIKKWMRDNDPISQKKIKWRGALEYFDVYQLPIEYLIYNRFNGRIQMDTLALVECGQEPNPETDEGHARIQQLLHDCKKGQNKEDMDDMEAVGQRESGIITEDGVIVDGNRRAMLLNLLNESFYEAAILPVSIGTSRKEIEELEAEIQLSTPAQHDYDPINIYLKVQSMFDNEAAAGIPRQEIPAKICGKLGMTAEKVEERLRIKAIMDKYLNHFKYDKIYTQLLNTEDRFIGLEKWWGFLHKDPGDYRKGFMGYKKHDVKDLRKLSYDFIRARFRGEYFRTIAKGNVGSHFFGNEKIWKAFLKRHNDEIVEAIVKNEPAIDRTDPDLLKTLKQRDSDYKNQAEETLQANWDSANDALQNKQDTDKPKKLAEDATKKINAIDVTHAASKQPETQEALRKLVKTAAATLKKVSGKPELETIIMLLETIQTMNIIDEKKPSAIEELDKIVSLATEIKQRLSS